MKETSPNVIIFNGRLLPASETFIKSQAEGLTRFQPKYVGIRRVKGLSLPNEHTYVINQGHITGVVKEIGFKTIGFAPKLLQQVKQLNPCLVHAHFGVCGALALPLVERLNVPFIVTYHGLDATATDEYLRKDSLSTNVYLKRRDRLKEKVTCIIAVSNFIKSKLVAQSFPADKIVVHYTGINRDRFLPNPQVVRKPIVLFVGRLTEKKGCEYLIEAMAKVQAAIEDVELVIVGDGLLRDSWEKQAKSTLKHYRFLGLQPPEVVRQWMNQAKVFCVPSVRSKTGDTEGFGMVFAEAQSMGLPVVSFASGGIPEAVAHGQTGFLAAEKDCSALGEHIIHLLQNSTLWQDFSLRGQARVKAKFDLAKQNQGLEDIYYRQLNQRS